MAHCLLALGANLGNPVRAFHNALQSCACLPLTRILARSTWHQTAPVGGPVGQPAYLNGAVLLETELAPPRLARHLKEIESASGRTRQIRWAARTLDIDVLLYGNLTHSESQLTIPHPRLTFRSFVLKPATEIAGHLVHPPSGWTLHALLRHLQWAPRYVAVVAADRRLARWLAHWIHTELACPLLEHFFPGEDVSVRLSALEWDKHEQLAARLPGVGANRERPQQPVVGCDWYELLPKNLQTNTNTLGGIIRPALVIALDPPNTEQFVSQIGLPTARNFEKHLSIAAPEFRKLLARRGHGPLAWIDTPDRTAAQQESVAAVQAAW